VSDRSQIVRQTRREAALEYERPAHCWSEQIGQQPQTLDCSIWQNVLVSIRIRLKRLAGSQVGGLVAGAPRIDQPANLMHSIQTSVDHEFKRGDAAEDLIPIPKLDPMVGQIVSVANVQPFVDPDEITDPEHAFLSAELRSWVEFELFDWCFTFERKQFYRLFIGQPPLHCDVEKSFEAGGPKPQALTLDTEVGHRPQFFVFLNFFH
jgi:hypothetical protein